MYLDIYNLATEEGVTIEAYAFRFQGAVLSTIECQPGEDEEWQDAAYLVGNGAFIVAPPESPLAAARVTLSRVSDVDVSPTPSGLFPVVRWGVES